MFSLIITIISIALVTALALATIYYGGNAFRQGGDAADAARFINEGQQLSGAASVYNAAEQADLALIADLTTKEYVASVPTGWTLDATNTLFELDAIDGDVCAKVNEKAGVSPATGAASSTITNYGCIPGATAADPGKMVFQY